MNNNLLNNVVEKGHFVLGEYTTDAGPYVEDHFIVLVSPHGEVFEFSTEDKDADEFLKDIERKVKQDIKLKLCNVTKFDSRILYPDFLIGQPFYNFKIEAYKKKNILEYIKNVGLKKVSSELSEPVVQYLKK